MKRSPVRAGRNKVLVLTNEHVSYFPFLDKEKTNYIEHFLEAMLFFKKSEQEKKVGDRKIRDILDFAVVGFHHFRE